MEDAGKLHADDTCPDDGQALRQGGALQQFGGGDQTWVVDVGQRQELCAAACGDDDVFCHDRVAAYVDGLGIDEGGGAAHEGDVGMSKDALNT